MRPFAITAAAGLALSACATVPADGDPPIREFAVITMEYAYGRVTVGYDASYTITSIGCS